MHETHYYIIKIIFRVKNKTVRTEICPQREAARQKRSLSIESEPEGGCSLGPRLRQRSPGCPRYPGGDSPMPSRIGLGDIFCLGGKSPGPISGGTR